MPENLEALTHETITWESEERVYKKRDREVFMTAASLCVLLSVILLFIKEWILIGVLWAVYFVFYVLNTTPPRTVPHKIDKNGVDDVPFDELNAFWFSQRNGSRLLNISYKNTPGILFLLLPHEVLDYELRIKNFLDERLTFREKVEPTWMEKASDWLTKNLPLETKNTTV